MKKWLIILFFLLSPAAYAQTSVQFGMNRTTSPWQTCVYDATNTCQPFLTLPSAGGAAALYPGMVIAVPLSGITGLGTGVATALAANANASGGAALSGGAFSIASATGLTSAQVTSALTFTPLSNAATALPASFVTAPGLPYSGLSAGAPTATSSVLGLVNPDGTTISNSAGVISVAYGTTSNTAAQGNDSRITGALSASATALPSSFLASSLTSVGTLSGLAVSGTSAFTGGNVGIGTTSPDSLVHVYTTAQDANDQLGHLFSVANTSGTSTTSLRLEKGGGYGGDIAGYIVQGGSSGLIFSALNGGTLTEVMRLTNAGYVGIGTTTPLGRVHVYASSGNVLLGVAAGANSYWAMAANSTTNVVSFGPLSDTNNINPMLTIMGNGNVGIGTTTPSTALQVVGVITATGSIIAGSHILATANSPAVSSCGTGSPIVSGSDTFGKISTGGGTLTSCVINFGTAFSAAPVCVTSFSASTLAATVATSTTQLTVGATSLTSETIFYHCGSVS